jgi:hypothetical protein
VEKEIRQPYPPSTAPTTTIRRVAKNPAFLGIGRVQGFLQAQTQGKKPCGKIHLHWLLEGLPMQAKPSMAHSSTNQLFINK